MAIVSHDFGRPRRVSWLRALVLLGEAVLLFVTFIAGPFLLAALLAE